MGVHNLWKLLEPVGRRVDVATLRNRIMAVDASIWLTQFVKAMRNAEGEMLENAHLLGTLRRILKLLFHRIRPVFVFDGGTPALKKKTVLRRQQRRAAHESRHAQAVRRLVLHEMQQRAKVRAAAEARASAPQGFSATSKPLGSAAGEAAATPERPASTSVPATPPSRGHDTNGGSIRSASRSGSRRSSTPRQPVIRGIEPARAAPGPGMAASAGAASAVQDMELDAEDEADTAPVLPSSTREVDLSVVMSLPPHMQKEYIEELRRQQRNESRAKLLPVAADPAIFSRAQLQGFLGIATFNARVDKMNAEAASSSAHGRRIASEAGREYLLVRDGDDVVQHAAGAAVENEPSADGYTISIARIKASIRAEHMPTSEDDLDDVGANKPDHTRDDGEADAASDNDIDDAPAGFCPDPHAVVVLPPPEPQEDGASNVARPGGAASASVEKIADMPITELSDVQRMQLLLHSQRPGWGARARGTRGRGRGRGRYTRALERRLEEGSKAASDVLDYVHGREARRGSLMHQYRQLGDGLSALSDRILGTSAATAEGAAIHATFGTTASSTMRVLQDVSLAPIEEDAVEELQIVAPVVPVDQQRTSLQALDVTTRQQSFGQQQTMHEDQQMPFSADRAVMCSPTPPPPMSVGSIHPGLTAHASSEVDIISGDDGNEEHDPDLDAAIRMSLAPHADASAELASYQREAEKGAETLADAVDDEDFDAVAGGFLPEGEEGSGAPPRAHLDNVVSPWELYGTQRNPTGGNPSRTEPRASIVQPTAGTTSDEHADEWEDVDAPATVALPLAASCVPAAAAVPVPPTKVEIVFVSDDEEGDSDPEPPPGGYEPSTATASSSPAAPHGERAVAHCDLVPAENTDTRMHTTNAPTRTRPSSPVVTDSSEFMLDVEGSAVSVQEPSAADALKEAYELAGKMRGWAKYAFARAVPGVAASAARPRSIPTGPSAAPSGAQPVPLAIARPQQDTPLSPITTSKNTSTPPKTTNTPPERTPPAAPQTPRAQAADNGSALPTDGPPVSTSSPMTPSTGAARTVATEAVDLTAEVDLDDMLDTAEVQQEMQRYNAQADGVAAPVAQAAVAGSASAGAASASSVPVELLSEEQQEHLRARARADARDTDGVTDSMRDDVILLLQLFGLPYIIAPMEAEAQCAELERAGLVDGVITDDSDAFLFGARTVYRHIFNEGKFVEVYLAEDITRELGVSRDDLIRSALLLGSDYTEGVAGVGPVNAMEILRAFPGDDGLVAFRQWLHAVDPTPPRRPAGEDLDSLEAIQRKFKASHKAGRKNWVVPDTFPSAPVMNAYRKPVVTHLDAATHAFAFQAIDVDGVVALCKDRFGWTQAKAMTEIMPTIRELSSGLKQMTLESYMRSYYDEDRAAKIKSTRLATAVRGLTKTDAAALTLEQDVIEVTKSTKPRAKPRATQPFANPGDHAAGQSQGASLQEGVEVPIEADDPPLQPVVVGRRRLRQQAAVDCTVSDGGDDAGLAASTTHTLRTAPASAGARMARTAATARRQASAGASADRPTPAERADDADADSSDSDRGFRRRKRGRRA